MPTQYKKTKFHFTRGPHANLERIYSLFSFSKRRGIGGSNSVVLQNKYPIEINYDLPFFYSLNRTFSSITEGSIGGVFFLGVNPRYEASLFNTTIRREQMRRSIPVTSLGAFSSLRTTNRLTVHCGNSFSSIQALLENRSQNVSQSRVNMSRYSVFQGAESFRRKNAQFLQSSSIALAKRLFSKTGSFSNFGTLHASVSSRAFAFIGIKNSLNQVKDDSSHSHVFFTVDSPHIYKKKFVEYFLPKKTAIFSFSTHGVQNSPSANYLVPITSLYERSGHFRVLEGRLRKHQKVVSKPKTTFNVESLRSAFCRSQDTSL